MPSTVSCQHSREHITRDPSMTGQTNACIQDAMMLNADNYLNVNLSF